MPAKNHISKHINNLIIPNQLFHCALKSRVQLTKKALACLPGFSPLIPTPLVLHDAGFPSRILSAPSYRGLPLICHLLGYYLEGRCTWCSSLKRLLAETLQLTLDTFPRHTGVSSNFLTQIPLCSSSTQSSPGSSYPAFPILLVNVCSLWMTLEWSLCLSYLGEWTENGGVAIPSSWGQTLLWITHLWVHERKSAAVSGMGKHLSMFPKLIKLFWNSGISTSLLCDATLSQLRKKGTISHWIEVAEPPAQPWKYTASIGTGLHHS